MYCILVCRGETGLSSRSAKAPGESNVARQRLNWIDLHINLTTNQSMEFCKKKILIPDDN